MADLWPIMRCLSCLTADLTGIMVKYPVICSLGILRGAGIIHQTESVCYNGTCRSVVQPN